MTSSTSSEKYLTDSKELEIDRLKVEIQLLRATNANLSKIEESNRHNQLLIDDQRVQIEDLKSKLSRLDVKDGVTPQQLNVKSYLAGVKMNLNTLMNENEEIEHDLSQE